MSGKVDVMPLQSFDSRQVVEGQAPDEVFWLAHNGQTIFLDSRTGKTVSFLIQIKPGASVPEGFELPCEGEHCYDFGMIVAVLDWEGLLEIEWSESAVPKIVDAKMKETYRNLVSLRGAEWGPQEAKR